MTPLLLALAGMVALGTGTAAADPVSGAIVSFLALKGLAATIGTFIINSALFAAASVAIGYAQKAIMGRPQQNVGGVQGRLDSGGVVPRSFIVGRWATPGSLAYAGTHGTDSDGDQKFYNAHLVYVISLSDLPIGGLVELWVNGEKVAFDAAAAKAAAGTASRGAPVPEYKGSEDHLWIKFYDGRQTAADPYLTSVFGMHPDRPYGSDRIGTGIAYAVVTVLIEEKFFTGFPQFKFVLDGIDLYDVRDDTSVGGDGLQRWGNPGTWSRDIRNPIIAVYNLARGINFGGKWFYGGQNLVAARLPYSAWAAPANECDRLVEKKSGGTEPQFEAGMEIRVDAEPAAIIEELLKSCNGRLAEIGGLYKPRVGAAGAAVLHITDDDIIITEAQELDPFPSATETFNGIDARYISPAEGWGWKDAPARRNLDLEAADGDQRLISGVDYGAVSNGRQVQRLMMAALKEARRWRRHGLVLPPEADFTEPLDTIAWTSLRNGYVNKLFSIEAGDDNSNLDQPRLIVETDPTDYDWAPGDDELPEVDGPIKIRRPPAQPIEGFTATGVIIEGDGVPQRAAIRMTWDPDARDVSGVQFQVRRVGGNIVLRDQTDQLDAGAIDLSQNILPETAYEARARYRPDSPRDTLWSGWLPAITPPVIESNINDEVSEWIENINQDLDDQAAGAKEDAANAARMVLGQRDELIGLFEQVTGALAGSGGRDFLAREAIRTELRVTFGGLSAALVREESVRVSKDEAIAASILSLRASLEGEIDGNATAILAVTARVSTAEGQIVSQSGLLAAFSAELDGLADDVSGNASAIFAVISRVSAAEDDLISQAALLVGLEAELNGLAEDSAGNSSAISGLTATVESHDDRITAASAATTALDSRLTNAEGVNTNQATAINGLSTRTASAENFLESLAADQTLLEARIEDAETDIAGNASALQSLTATVNLKARVYRQAIMPALPDDPLTGGDLWINTGDNNRLFRWNTTSWVDSTSTNMTVFRQAAAPNTSVIGALWFDTDDNNKLYRWSGSAWVDASDPRVTVHAQLITALEAQLEDAEGNIAGLSAAFDSMEAEVTNIDGRVTAQGTRLSLVEAGVGDATAQGLLSFTSIAAKGSASTRIALRARATTADAFAQAGIYLDAIAGQPSRVLILANQFFIANGTGENVVAVPFGIVNGKVRMKDVEILGGLLVEGTITATEIIANGITKTTRAFTASVGSTAYISSTTAPLQEVTIDSDGFDVLIQMSAIFDISTPGQSGTRYCSLHRNGVELLFIRFNPVVQTLNFFYHDSAALTGPATYVWQHDAGGNSGNYFIGNRLMSASFARR